MVEQRWLTGTRFCRGEHIGFADTGVGITLIVNQLVAIYAKKFLFWITFLFLKPLTQGTG